MLQLRPEQWRALSRGAEQTYSIRLTAFLRDEFPAARELPVSELQDEVVAQVARAQGYGLKAGDEVATYVVCAWQLGTDFDTAFPAAAHLLNSPDYTPEQKRDWLQTWSVAMFDELEAGD